MTDSHAQSSLESLESQLRELRDLFQRRLVEDKSKNQLIQIVQADLEARSALDRGDAFFGMFQEVLLAVDRLLREEATAELNLSVAREVLEVLARRGLRAIPSEGHVDARVHEVIGAVEARGSIAPGTIVDVRREGYTLASRVLRPAQVVVAAEVSGESIAPVAESGEPGGLDGPEGLGDDGGLHGADSQQMDERQR